jgi:tellurite resistance protein TerC
MGVFHYLKPALSVILAFVGAKMLLADVYKIPPQVSLAVVGSILGIALALSLRTEWKRRRGAGARQPGLSGGRPASRHGL